MKLSIVTINRNDAAGLARTLRSTFDEQSGFDDWEQIVVDGASTDGSFAEVDRYRGNPHLGWCISEPDTGIFNAMNKGAAHARGDYLLFLNAGDALLPGVLAEVFSVPRSEDLLYGDVRYEWPEGPVLRCYPTCEQLRPCHFLTDSLPHQGTFISRGLHEIENGYDESFRCSADTKFFFRALTEFNATAIHLGLVVSTMDTSGVSCQPGTLPKRLAERRRFLEPYFGKSLYHVVRLGLLMSRQMRMPQIEALATDPVAAEQFRRFADWFFFLRKFWIGRGLLAAFAWLTALPERLILFFRKPSGPDAN